MFCLHCGKEVPGDSAFCMNCGGALKAHLGESKQEDKKHKVIIFRQSQMYVLNPPINISVNGRMDASIENGGRRELLLSPGKYVFDFSANMRRRTVDISLNRDIQITLSWNRLTGALNAVIANL